MKNIILLALVLLMSTGQAWAQNFRHSKAASSYRPMTTFNGDTAAYMEFNYAIRSVQYIGKTVGEILNELEFPVLYIAEILMAYRPNAPVMVPRLGLGIRQVGKAPDIMQDYYISVLFENPPTFDRFREAAGGGNHPVFTPKLYDFIKDLKVTDVGSNEFITKDTEILENYRRVFEENKRRGREGQEEWERKRRENGR